ncbi:InlB B-repeat-containing protein [Gordonibacter massiliensis (ex Traore et al. 2017)]|uniref:InlB B-repeat-containing protein n=1 Tax=Gordonibacter massiliensis (ex Traore et al. 2017) TaxID=1841863 RepID=A0A842JAZ8_9ACTN|nr:InlB B-repeat-containing protein [Gordonibacter massiliensis (ex Traore et al. 2017)]MBC2889033.1 InlB B-repeat-containing protein [Gordonibacter massiliensis (ex Traore et al. 2017)]
MHTIRTLPTSPPARRTTAVLLALLLALSMIPLAAFAGTSEETYDLPAPPSNVQASADQDLIRISWDPVDGQAIYALYRSETGTDPWQTVNVTSSTSWADTRAEPGKTYYYFLIAYINEEGSDPSNIVSARIPLPTYPATYYRNFDADDQTSLFIGDFEQGDTFTLANSAPSDWDRSDYRLLGWNTDRTSTEGDMGEYTMPNHAVSLYAIWGSLHRVTYDGAGADGGIVPVDSNKYLAGEEVTVPRETPTKTGYTFGGWKEPVSGRVCQPGGLFLMPEQDTTLEALWAEHADAGQNMLELDDDDLTAGDTVRFTATGHRQDATGSAGGETRFVPVSWTIAPIFDGVSFPFDSSYPFRGSAIMSTPGSYTVTAVYQEQFFNICCDTWEPTDNTTTLTKPFTVKGQLHDLVYNRNYTPDDATVQPGGTFRLNDPLAFSGIGSVGVSGADWSRDGYRFMGWSADRAAEQGAMDGVMPDEPLTMYAVWAPEYAVTYAGNGHDGGTVPVDELAYVKGDTVTVASDAPTRTGYSFAGWKADHDGKTYRAGDTFAMPEGGARLVAQWTPKAAPGPNGGGSKAAPAALSKMGFLPKTGDEAVPFVLLGVAAAAGALGVRSLRRRSQG